VKAESGSDKDAGIAPGIARGAALPSAAELRPTKSGAERGFPAVHPVPVTAETFGRWRRLSGMHARAAFRRSVLIFGSALLGAWLLAGCGGPPRGGPGGDRAMLRPMPPLEGQEPFFDDQLLVEINVSAFGFKGREPRGDGEAGEGGGPRRGGGMGAGMSGSFGPVQGGFGGGGGGRRGGPGGEGGPGAGAAVDPEQYRIRNIQRGVSRRPPVMIHVRVTNRGPAPATVRILDFLSPLGNFVVLPEKLEIAPGAAVETEPMASQLGGEFTEVPVTLVLHTGGRREKKTLTLRLDPDAPTLDGQPPSVPDPQSPPTQK